MSQHKDESNHEIREHKEERIAANSEAKQDDKGSTGQARHRGDHSNSQSPGKTKDGDE